MKKIIKDTLALALITVIAGIALGAVYMITKEPIEKQNEKTKIAAYNAVFSDLDTYEEYKDAESLSKVLKENGFNAVDVNEVVYAYNSKGEDLGMIITVTDKEGYGGNIKMTVGIDVTGTITGLEILEISETAGLGMKAADKSFRDQYVGINADEVVYTKSGKTQNNEIDAISSATITTKAVTDGVNGAITIFKELQGGSVDE
jgi:electron transport complex protein RnfG